MVNAIMQDPAWRNALNVLCDLLGCTRYRAARVIAAGMREGYFR